MSGQQGPGISSDLSCLVNEDVFPAYSLKAVALRFHFYSFLPIFLNVHLVGGFNPSEKDSSSSIGMMTFPTEWKFIKVMFQSPPTRSCSSWSVVASARSRSRSAGHPRPLSCLAGQRPAPPRFAPELIDGLLALEMCGC